MKSRDDRSEIVINLTMEVDVTTLLLEAHQRACEKARASVQPEPPMPELPLPGQDVKVGEIRQTIRIPRA